MLSYLYVQHKKSLLVSDEMAFKQGYKTDIMQNNYSKQYQIARALTF